MVVLEACDNDGRAPLNCKFHHRSLDDVELLIPERVTFRHANTRCLEWRVTLQENFRRIKVGWYFLDQGVELHLRTSEGETSSHLSTRVGYHLDKVWLMVEKGALTDTETNRFGKTTPTLGVDDRHE